MTTTPYTPEEIAKAQQIIDEEKTDILYELDVERAQFPQIYAHAPRFCTEARASRVTGYTYVLDRADLKQLGLPETLPCGCYHGVGSDYDLEKALENSVAVCQVMGNSYKISPIESILGLCTQMETERNPSVKDIQRVPIPWSNPALQLLVALIEQHLAS